MSYGSIEYNDKGLPKCEICGHYFNRILCHARQVHNIKAEKYKKKFGLDLHKGICSQKSHLKSRKAVLKNKKLVIDANLIKKGTNSRFKKGHEGRTKEKVSKQTQRRLKEKMKSKEMIEIDKINGKKYGKFNLIKYNGKFNKK